MLNKLKASGIPAMKELALVYVHASSRSRGEEASSLPLTGFVRLLTSSSLC